MNNLDQHFWDDRYHNGTTGWDVGEVSTPIKNYIDQLENKQIRVLIPGCGNAYEATYLLEKGFTNITVLDISPVVVELMKERLKTWLNNGLKIVCADFFAHEGQYDLVIEQTFFCALDPGLRKKYVSKMAELLKAGGKLVGVMFNREFETSPPFGGNEAEYRSLFDTVFEVKKMEPCYNSITPRVGSELFIMMEKKP